MVRTTKHDACTLCHNYHNNNNMIFIIPIANCGHPELLLTTISKNSTPKIEAYNDLPVEGSTVRFSCPPGLVLIGPNLATCTVNGEWEPDPSQLMCISSEG